MSLDVGEEFILDFFGAKGALETRQTHWVPLLVTRVVILFQQNLFVCCKTNSLLLLMEEIPNNHLGCIKTL